MTDEFSDDEIEPYRYVKIIEHEIEGRKRLDVRRTISGRDVILDFRHDDYDYADGLPFTPKVLKAIYETYRLGII